MGTRTFHYPDKLCGVTRLLEDLHRLSEDKDSADVVFFVGREEIHAHRVILKARCTSFQNIKRGEICKVPGTTVSPATPGTSSHLTNANHSLSVIRWPQANQEVLKEVILYIYTGKIILHDNNVFEALAIAYELGIDDLKQTCEEHIATTLTVHNACIFLPSALSLQNRIPENKSCSSFVERCTSFIGENASECVKTSSFLMLSKEAMIHLISSDYLALDEADVFRAALNWAKHQAGVMQPTQHWTEEERARICQQLSGVINHIRILLIDSQVFAEEVEPTGAVPMELSLERYKYAALPSKYSRSEDKKFQPRTSLKLFQGSKILTGDKLQFQRILNAWFGSPKQIWKLIYKASVHGYSAEAFHHHCDGISPTFVILMGENGEICGGFSDVPWGKPTGRRGKYVQSEKAFLFTLINNQDLPPTKFDVVKKMFAIVHHNDFGPVFGAGADLSISSDCNSNLESYSNLPHSYDGENASCSILMGDYNFSIFDYEVFTISD